MLLEEARAKAKGLVELIFGFNFNNMEGLDKGAKAIGGKFEKLTWVLKTLKTVQDFKKIDMISIMRNESAGEYLRKSLLLIANMVHENLKEKKPD